MVRFSKPFWLLSLITFFIQAGVAQRPNASAEDASTLHVYVNRIQIPVLILSQYGRAIRPIPESNFTVSINGMGSFRPTNVRVEGDDPLAVAVIVNASDRHETTWHDLPKAIEKLLPKLNPHDALTLYGMDGCKAQRFLPEGAALNATLIYAGVTAAMAMQARSGTNTQTAACSSSLTMADMVFYVAARLANFPGRRMIVTVEAGTDSGYATQMPRLKQLLNARSIMLLPLVHDSAYAAMPVPYIPRGSGAVGVVNAGIGTTYANLAELAEFSGGRVRYIASHEFTGALADAVTTARGRYILEFPRPDKLEAGHYQITVMDGHPRDFIRVSGVSVPVATAEEVLAAKSMAEEGRAATPNTLTHSDTAAEDIPATSTPSGVTGLAITTGSNPTATTIPTIPTPAVAPQPTIPPPDLTDITGDLRPSH